MSLRLRTVKVRQYHSPMEARSDHGTRQFLLYLSVDQDPFVAVYVLYSYQVVVDAVLI
jgi:hypothetical protein